MFGQGMLYLAPYVQHSESCTYVLLLIRQLHWKVNYDLDYVDTCLSLCDFKLTLRLTVGTKTFTNDPMVRFAFVLYRKCLDSQPLKFLCSFFSPIIKFRSADSEKSSLSTNIFPHCNTRLHCATLVETQMNVSCRCFVK